MRYHITDELAKRTGGLPPERVAGTSGITYKQVYFGRSIKTRIFDYEFPIVEANLAESQIAKFTNGMRFAGRDHEIRRFRLL